MGNLFCSTRLRSKISLAVLECLPRVNPSICLGTGNYHVLSGSSQTPCLIQIFLSTAFDMKWIPAALKVYMTLQDSQKDHEWFLIYHCESSINNTYLSLYISNFDELHWNHHHNNYWLYLSQKCAPWVLSWRSWDWLWRWKRYVERRDEARRLTLWDIARVNFNCLQYSPVKR